MLSIPKNPEPRLKAWQGMPILIAAIFLCLISGAGQATGAEEPGHLTIIPDSGLILLDYDTLKVVVPSTVDLAPGDHLLSFFPYHTDTRWAHRYVDYHFNLGAGGRRTIDLTRREIFSLNSDPQSAEIYYRGKMIGRTPGDYMFLLGARDSVKLSLRGYEEEVVSIDDALSSGVEIFAVLDALSPVEYAGEIEPVRYTSPLRPLLEPQMLIPLCAGAAMLVTGAHFNQKADDNYERYLRLAGSDAREKAYQDAVHNDRLSRVAFIAGDVSIGMFGYFVIRKLVFRDPSRQSDREKQRTLSLDMTARGTVLSYKF